MNISVVGTGYVGLVTGTCFAETGNNVTCIDIDEQKVKKMQAGEVPIYEPDLDSHFKNNIGKGNLHFTTDLKAGITNADAIFLALPTPPGEDGSADLSYILGASGDIGKLLKDYVVIVDKSTVPVGTADLVKQEIAKHYKGSFDVVSNPEFLREGRAINDFMKPDRVVIGSDSTKATEVMERLYKPFVRHGNPIIKMDIRSAELTKYAANAFLATKISFMNEMANLCEATGADIESIMSGMGSDHRIGKEFLHAGIGYGGSCFPKDVQAISHTASEYGQELFITHAVQEVNKRQKQLLAKKVSSYYDNALKGKKIALWGLAFKPDTDDIREAPSLEIIKELTEAGASVVAYDPEAIPNVKRVMSDNTLLQFAQDEYEALTDADALVIATEWKAFQTPDFAKMKQLLKNPVIFDGRNLYTKEEMEEFGFYYESIGRKVVNIDD